MNLEHKQRRIDGKRQWYWLDTDTGLEFATKREHKQYMQAQASSGTVQRYSLTEQTAYSYMRNRSVGDKAYAVRIMQRDQNKAYHQVQQRRYWAQQAMDTEFYEEVQCLAWDEVREDWYSTSKTDSKAVEIPVVHYLVEDYLERLLRHSALIVENGGVSLSREDIKALLKASDSESYRWYNAVQDAWEVCSNTESATEVPF